jgi:hypothetical protein
MLSLFGLLLKSVKEQYFQCRRCSKIKKSLLSDIVTKYEVLIIPEYTYINTSSPFVLKNFQSTYGPQAARFIDLDLY